MIILYFTDFVNAYLSDLEKKFCVTLTIRKQSVFFKPVDLSIKLCYNIF